MPIIIWLTGTNWDDVWINAGRIVYMKHSDGETAIYLEGSSVPIYVKEEPKQIMRLIDEGGRQ